MNNFNTNIQDIYPLSPMQEGMLFHSLTDNSSDTYVVQMVIPISGDLKVELLEESFNLLVKKYEVFRTTYIYENMKEPVQVVLNERKAEFDKKSIEFCKNEDREAYIKAYIEKDRKRGFDITQDPLVRISALHIKKMEWIIIFSFHHILMDGWCSDIFLNDLFRFYHGLNQKMSNTLHQTNQYSAYIKWLQEQDNNKAKAYWDNYLHGYEELSSIPRYRKIEDETAFDKQECILELDNITAEMLMKLAKSSKVTCNSLFQTMWGVLLQKYNNKDDVVFGAVVSGRPSEIQGVENIVGLFINTIPVRVSAHQNTTFRKLLLSVNSRAIESQNFDYCPLSKIQNGSIGSNLFDHIIVYDNNPVNKEWRNTLLENGLRVREIEVIERTNYNFGINVIQQEGILIKFVYNANVYEETEIQNLAKHFNNVINIIISNPEIQIKDISYLTDYEKKLLLDEFNNHKFEYPRDKTIPDLFELQVEKTPDRIALSLKGSELSYKELNNSANKIAMVLQKEGVKPNDLIGVIADRSFGMIIAILGVLKSNGAYLPLDIDNPKDRLSMIIADSKARIVLIERAMLNKCEGILKIFRSNNIKHLILEDILEVNEEIIYDNPSRCSTSEDLIYVMYTSGSTGKPKGVLTVHRNVVNVVNNVPGIEINQEDVVLQLSNFAFDASPFNIFGSLVKGAKLVLVPKETILNMGELIEVLQDEKITIFAGTTALFHVLVDLDIGSFKEIRKIIFGGEKVSLPHIKKALEFLGKGRLINAYGPTECTIYTIYHEINKIDQKITTVPIGIPLPNTKAYIFSKYNDLQPVGAVGEICIAGDGLANGYLYNEELTREKFIENPHRLGEVIYKTGDLGRWLPNGKIEYAGRIDDQVKLRGFRIELGEIEDVILRHNMVKQAVVMVSEDRNSEKRLCCYFISEGELEINKLREFVLDYLPQYMLPTFFVPMDTFPLNHNGKINKNLLPKPKLNDLENVKYVAPKNRMEEMVIKIWQEVLGVEKIGMFHNYFNLGGDSIKSIQISSRLRDCGYSMSVKDLFQNPTVAAFSKCISEIKQKEEYISTSFEETLLSDQDFNELANELELSID